MRPLAVSGFEGDFEDRMRARYAKCRTKYKALWDSNLFKLVLTTGRAEKWRAFTENWLFWNDIPFSELLMRPNKDNRADHLLKQEFLERLLARGDGILFAVDDRQQVVDMWRRNGITCLQCAPGDF